MANFATLGLSAATLDGVRALGYDEPTPIQEQTIPLALAGHDVIAGAQTGTGKTAAFCLPSLDQLAQAAPGRGPVMLVVTPTRELADQVADVCGTIAASTGHTVLSVVGGVSYNPQKEALAQGVDVLIATPGRLEDLIAQGAADMSEVEILVLDEADHMLDLGFRPSVMAIAKQCVSLRQTLLFSATLDDRIERIAKELLKDPVRVEVARPGEAAATIEQHVVHISHAAKPSALAALLEQRGKRRVLVFVRTHHRADAVAERLNRSGIRCESIHSKKSQAERQRALSQFASGAIDLLVATDVLARGIDIDEISYVINYDLPEQPQDYVHRIGRTGRAGAQGCTISLVAPENAQALKAIERLVGRRIPTMELRGVDIDTLDTEARIRSRQLQARRSGDPEIEAAVKELNAKERREHKKKRAEGNDNRGTARKGGQQGNRSTAGNRGKKAPSRAGGKAGNQGRGQSSGRGSASKGKIFGSGGAKPAPKRKKH